MNAEEKKNRQLHAWLKEYYKKHGPGTVVVKPSVQRRIGRRAHVHNNIGEFSEAKDSINSLVSQLRRSTDPSEKKKIRRLLRRMGHAGGAR